MSSINDLQPIFEIITCLSRWDGLDTYNEGEYEHPILYKISLVYDEQLIILFDLYDHIKLLFAPLFSSILFMIPFKAQEYIIMLNIQ